MSSAPPRARQESLPLIGRRISPSADAALRLLRELKTEIANGNAAIRRMRKRVESDRRTLQTRINAKGRPEPHEPRPTNGWRLRRLPGLEAA